MHYHLCNKIEIDAHATCNITTYGDVTISDYSNKMDVVIWYL